MQPCAYIFQNECFVRCIGVFNIFIKNIKTHWCCIRECVVCGRVSSDVRTVGFVLIFFLIYFRLVFLVEHTDTLIHCRSGYNSVRATRHVFRDLKYAVVCWVLCCVVWCCVVLCGVVWCCVVWCGVPCFQATIGNRRTSDEVCQVLAMASFVQRVDDIGDTQDDHRGDQQHDQPPGCVPRVNGGVRPARERVRRPAYVVPCRSITI